MSVINVSVALVMSLNEMRKEGKFFKEASHLGTEKEAMAGSLVSLCKQDCGVGSKHRVS